MKRYARLYRKYPFFSFSRTTKKNWKNCMQKPVHRVSKNLSRFHSFLACVFSLMLPFPNTLIEKFARTQRCKSVTARERVSRVPFSLFLLPFLHLHFTFILDIQCNQAQILRHTSYTYEKIIFFAQICFFQFRVRLDQ